MIHMDIWLCLMSISEYCWQCMLTWNSWDVPFPTNTYLGIQINYRLVVTIINFILQSTSWCTNLTHILYLDIFQLFLNIMKNISFIASHPSQLNIKSFMSLVCIHSTIDKNMYVSRSHYVRVKCLTDIILQG